MANGLLLAPDDKSIRVWDAETGEMVSGPFKGHTDVSPPSHFHLMANGLPLAPLTNPFVFGMPRLVRWSLAPLKATRMSLVRRIFI
jgi:hypothetical protein